MYREKIKRHPALGGMVVLILLALVTVSCEQIFTYSPVTFAQRDPANLPDAQKVAYAQSILGSGASQEDLAAAYEAIADSSDPEVQLLASQVAVAASGINEMVSDILDNLDTFGEPGQTIDDYINSIDDTMLANAITSMDAANADSSTSETISSEDYLVTAAAVILTNSSDLENEDFSDAGFSNPDKDGTWQQKTAYYLDEAGYTTDDLDELLNFGS